MKKAIIAIGIIVALVVGITLLKPKNGDTEKSSLSSSTSLHKSSDSNFKQLLAYVPQDTSYLFGNREVIPEKYINKQIENIQKVVDSFKDILTEENKDKNISNIVEFVSNYYKYFIKNYKNNTVESMGYDKRQKMVIYGYDFYPVLRADIISSKSFIDSINGIATESNLSIEWEKCGQYECLQSEDNSSDLSVIFIVKDKSIALSIYDKSNKNKMLKHLTQNATLKNSYSIKEFDTFLKENSFKGFGDGFIDIDRLTQYVVSKSELDKSCSPIALDIAKKVNRLTFGTTALSEKEMNILMILNMDSNLTKSLKGLTNKNLFTQRVSKPIFDFGLNINAKGLSSAMVDLTNYLIAEGEKYNCKKINPQELRQGVAMASMSIGMSIGQLSELYISLNELKMDDKNKMPSKVEASLQIASPNPSSLINMLKMLSPEFASLNIPTTGEEIDILQNSKQPLPPFITELKASIKDKIISLRLGKKAKMEQFKPKNNTLSWGRINAKKYYKFLSMAMEQSIKVQKEAMQNVPNTDREEYEKMLKEAEENNAKAEKLIKALYEFDAISTSSVYFDDRGMVMELNEKYY
jgi:hypothetical protein